MAFQLTIAAGKEVGRSFTFNQSAIVVGRTTECDVVLYEPGVSRKHARIYNEKGTFFVEDMGSANGTRVNGAGVKKSPLNDGDSVEFGSVTFKFAGKVDSEVADAYTRIFSESDVQRSVKKEEALVPTDASSQELEALRGRRTQMIRSINSALPAKKDDTRLVDVENILPVKPAAISNKARLSFAEKERIRRDSPNGLAQLRIFWRESSPTARRNIYLTGGFLVLCIWGAISYTILKPEASKSVNEPRRLSKAPLTQTFGLGEGVVFSHRDSKIFDFEFNTALKSVVVLHFQAKDISEGEVMVTVNAKDRHSVPADTFNSDERSLEVIIPSEAVKNNEKNIVSFDNVVNAKASKPSPWRVWNIWVEVDPLPEMSAGALVVEASEAFKSAQQKFDQASIGASNLYEAWKGYRKVWLLMEAHPFPKPELYDLSLSRMHEAQQQLDHQCVKLLLEAAVYYNRKDLETARSALDHVKDYFPGTDQACPWTAEQKRYDYGL